MLTAGATAIGLLIFSTIVGALPNGDLDQQEESRHSGHVPAGADLAFRAAPVEVPKYTPDPADREIWKVKAAFAEGVPGNPKAVAWQMASDRRRSITIDNNEDEEVELAESRHRQEAVPE